MSNICFPKKVINLDINGDGLKDRITLNENAVPMGQICSIEKTFEFDGFRVPDQEPLSALHARFLCRAVSDEQKKMAVCVSQNKIEFQKPDGTYTTDIGQVKFREVTGSEIGVGDKVTMISCEKHNTKGYFTCTGTINSFAVRIMKDNRVEIETFLNVKGFPPNYRSPLSDLKKAGE